MKIYFAHSKDFDFINEYYNPIEKSEKLKDFNLIFPHKHLDENKNLREFYSSLDILIAEVSYPAVGLGIELAWAHADKIPIYTFYKKGTKPSFSLTSITENITEYSDSDDLVSKVEEVINLHNKK